VNENLGRIFPLLEQELKQEIKEGNIKETTLVDIFLTMVSLNIGVFLVQPIFANLHSPSDVETLLSERGKENARILLLSLSVKGKL
jgi:hypothetical protein